MKIKTKLPDVKEQLDGILDTDFTLHTFRISCNEMPFPNDYNINYRECHEDVKSIFRKMEPVDKPCLYWFEAETIEDANLLLTDLNLFRDKPKDLVRVTPVKNNNTDSTVLYVGARLGGIAKRKQFSFIAGRILAHLGYYKVGSTQGLQLAYWAKHLFD